MSATHEYSTPNFSQLGPMQEQLLSWTLCLLLHGRVSCTVVT